MIRLRTLDNGIRVVTEHIGSVRSCGIGVWLETGSRHEQPGDAGLSHFLEHMLFKGTGRHTARQLADAMNYLGGNVNAFTTQELICLHARTIDRKAPDALDLLCEMLTDSQFPDEEVRRERQVVLEEFKMIEDTPDEFSTDLFIQNLWPDDPLGRPVMGRRDVVRRVTRERLMAFRHGCFRPDRLVIALAGSFDARACGQVIRRRLAGLPPAPGRWTPPAAPAPERSPRQGGRRRPVEQAHFCLGAPAPHRRSPDRYAFGLMNMILGGGMSSRLFQEIREKRGLAYAIGSFCQLFSDTGFFAVAGGTSEATLGEVLAITHDEVDRMIAHPVPAEELEMARAQVLDATVMGLENMESRMMRLADGIMAHGRVTGVDEAIRMLNKVTPDDVLRVARQYLGGRRFAMGMVAPQGGSLLKFEPMKAGGER